MHSKTATILIAGILALSSLPDLAQSATPQNLMASGVTRPVHPPEANCLSAVARYAGTNDVSMVTMRHEGGENVLTVKAGNASRPWTCRAKDDGTVTTLVKPSR